MRDWLTLLRRPRAARRLDETVDEAERAGSRIMGSAEATLHVVAQMAINRTVDALSIVHRRVVEPGEDGDVESTVRGDLHPVTILLMHPAAGLTRPEWSDLVFRPFVARGMGWARIVRLRGRPVQLLPVKGTPTRQRIGAPVAVTDSVTGRRMLLNPRDVLALRGPGWDGRSSYDPLAALRGALKLSDAAWQRLIVATESRREVVEWDSGLLSTPRVVEKRGNEIAAELDDAGESEPLRLPAGARLAAGGIGIDDEQLLPTIDATVTEVGRAFNMPPGLMWGDGYPVTARGAGGRDDALWWSASIRPLDRRICAAMTRILLTPDDITLQREVESVSRRLGGAVPDPRLVGELVASFGLLTPSEGRELLGYGARTDGDSLLQPRGSGRGRNQNQGDD